MAWALILARDAEKQFARLPRRDLERVARALAAMRDDPYAGDVRRLVNLPHAFRRPVGDYRILFDVDEDQKRVEVAATERRSERTYRR
jgi:mRNA-degrading endonuclease RelE of RelBE toxin-antitoxin system